MVIGISTMQAAHIDEIPHLLSGCCEYNDVGAAGIYNPITKHVQYWK